MDKAAEQAAGGEAPPSVLTLRFEGTLELFTADLEKAFMRALPSTPASRRRRSSCSPRRRARSCSTWRWSRRRRPMSRAIATVDGASLDELSAALDVKMLSKSVRAKAKEAKAAEEERSRTRARRPASADAATR